MQLRAPTYFLLPAMDGSLGLLELFQLPIRKFQDSFGGALSRKRPTGQNQFYECAIQNPNCRVEAPANNACHYVSKYLLFFAGSLGGQPHSFLPLPPPKKKEAVKNGALWST